MKIAESILSALREPVLVLDGALRAIMANPAFYKALQIVPGRLEGKSVQELIAGEGVQPRLGKILEAVAAQDSNVKDEEIECLLPPDTLKVFSVNARRISAGDNLTEMVLVELREITRERETGRRIRELNEALRQHGAKLEGINDELESFTHSVSHDLRTPLRLTNKIAHLLLENHRAQLPAEAIDMIHMILDSTHEMGKLMEDLLTFSRVSREPMRKRRVDMRRLAREALEELEDQREGRDVEVVIDELPSCQADRALLKQVYLNLLTNALKFTRSHEQAEIQVGFTQPNGEAVYFVRDNGIGFSMSHSDSIFLAFHRLHRTHDFEGSGVGLALVKRIIERHGGRIWAESQTGQGATFYFTLGE